jgi:hypothetical protein
VPEKTKSKSVHIPARSSVAPEGKATVVTTPSYREPDHGTTIQEVQPPAGRFDHYPEIRHDNPRLKLLQELYMEGTISREVYEKRKKEIMQGGE